MIRSHDSTVQTQTATLTSRWTGETLTSSMNFDTSWFSWWRAETWRHLCWPAEDRLYNIFIYINIKTVYDDEAFMNPSEWSWTNSSAAVLNPHSDVRRFFQRLSCDVLSGQSLLSQTLLFHRLGHGSRALNDPGVISWRHTWRWSHVTLCLLIKTNWLWTFEISSLWSGSLSVTSARSWFWFWVL